MDGVKKIDAMVAEKVMGWDPLKALADARAEIERLKEEIAGLKGLDLVNESIIATKDSRISSLEADCALLGACVEARRREKVAREGFHRQEPTHTHTDWVKAIEDRFVSDNKVDTSPTASAWVKGTQ